MRYVLVVVVLVLVVGGLAYTKFAQISSLMAMGAEMEKSGPPPEMVSSAVAKTEVWEGTLTAVGSVAGAKSVALSNDAPGRVRRIHFESGAVVKQGQVLVELDSSVERANLGVLTSRRDLARVKAARSRALVAERVAPQAELDNNEAELRTLEAEVGALRAEIERKTVRAPFAGRLGIRAVNMGQYLNPGTTLTTLEEAGAEFVDFSLPQQDLAALKPNMPVRVVFDNGKSTASGVLTAIAPDVDAATRSVKLRASVPNSDGKLRPGMFVNVSVVTPSRGSVVTVPATAIVHAPYGDSVFTVENKEAGTPGPAEQNGKPIRMARQKFVRLGEARGDFVAIVDGVKAGEEVVSAGAFKLRNNSPIVVDNSVQAEAELHPKPENH